MENRRVRKTRKHEFKLPHTNSYLIITEGMRTEPLYFGGLKKQIDEKIGGNIDIAEVTIDVLGQGASTEKLVEIADRLVKESKVIYQNVWLVFDKDDFKNFDEAIELAQSKGYQVAWSNQSFEYWLYLHFDYSEHQQHRKEWNRKLSEIFYKNQWNGGVYRKNDQLLYEHCDVNDGVNRAIKNAKKRMAPFDSKKHVPSTYNPGTMVHLLVEELKKYLEEM